MSRDNGFIDLGDFGYDNFDPSEFNRELENKMGGICGSSSKDGNGKQSKEDWGREIGDDLRQLATDTQEAIEDFMKSQKLTTGMIRDAQSQYRQVADGMYGFDQEFDGTNFEENVVSPDEARQGIHEMRQQAGEMMTEADRLERYFDMEGGI